MAETQALASMYDITIILPLDGGQDIAAIIKIMSRLQECLALKGIQLERSKLRALLAGGII